jgi:hypothetical protein
MAFDLATAKPAGGFDLATAKPIDGGGVHASTNQPTFMQDVIASPVGRLVHDVAAPVVEGAASEVGKLTMGMFLGSSPSVDKAIDEASRSVIEGPYQNALAAERNRPGYTAARENAEEMAGQRHSGFMDQVTAPLNSAMAGTVGLVHDHDASNAAADVQEETQGEYAREHPVLATAGNILGAAITGAPEAAPVGPAQKATRTIADLRKQASDAYGVVDNSGMQIKQDSVQGLVDGVKTKLAELGLTDKTMPSLAPKTATAVNSLEDATEEDAQSLQGLEMQRRIAGLAAKSTDKTDRMAARVVQDHIDDFVANLKPEDVHGAVDQESIDALGNARDYWQRASKAQTIQDTIDKAANAAGGDSAFSPTFETSLRTKFRALANSQRAMSRFSPAEAAAIKDVATGGSTFSARNLLQIVGKLSPTNVIPALGEAAGVIARPEMAAVPIAGLGAKIGATAMTKAAANRALQTAIDKGEQAAPVVSAPLFNRPQITEKARNSIGAALGAAALRQQPQSNQ